MPGQILLFSTACFFFCPLVLSAKLLSFIFLSCVETPVLKRLATEILQLYFLQSLFERIILVGFQVLGSVSE